MHTYSLYVEDDRYSVPTLEFVTASDVTAALRVASAKLADSPHHRGVEVREDDRFLIELKAPVYPDEVQQDCSR